MRAALILVHNHPSGDPTPSRGDIEMSVDEWRSAVDVNLTSVFLVTRAVIAGMRAALGAVVQRFDPARIEQRLSEPPEIEGKHRVGKQERVAPMTEPLTPCICRSSLRAVTR